MIVLVVMVGLLAIAWPNLQRRLRRTTLDEAAHTVRQAIDEGRYQAISTGAPFFVQLRQGEHEVQTGSFTSFAEADSSNFDRSTSVDSGIEASEIPIAGLSDSSTSISHPKVWQLPESVVIYQVTWSSTPSRDDSSGTPEDIPNQLANENDRSGEIAPIAETATEEEILSLGTLTNEWWLPITATGQSRDAEIVLLDTAANEKLTVVYVSTTGALEIVR